jgi:hypothetical protein
MINFDKHTYARESFDKKIRSWHVPSLWEHVKDYEIIEVDVLPIIECINDYINKFDAGDWERVMSADLSYPIIVNDICGIADGCHRTVKAMFLGMDKIRAVRIVEFPEPMRVWNNWKDYDDNP